MLGRLVNKTYASVEVTLKTGEKAKISRIGLGDFSYRTHQARSILEDYLDPKVTLLKLDDGRRVPVVNIQEISKIHTEPYYILEFGTTRERIVGSWSFPPSTRWIEGNHVPNNRIPEGLADKYEFDMSNELLEKLTNDA